MSRQKICEGKEGGKGGGGKEEAYLESVQSYKASRDGSTKLSGAW